MEAVCIGIDVAKDTLDVQSFPLSKARQLPNTPAGISKLLRQLKAANIHRIIIEATGGYETPVVAELADAGLPVVLINPRRVRDYARAIGVLAKTDAIDAAVLARFGHAVQPPTAAAADGAGTRHGGTRPSSPTVDQGTHKRAVSASAMPSAGSCPHHPSKLALHRTAAVHGR